MTTKMKITKNDRPKFKIERAKTGSWALFAYLQNGQKIIPITAPATCGTLAYCEAVRNTVTRDFKRHGELTF